MLTTPKVPVGFATVVGQLAAIAQFAGAVVVLVVGTKAQQGQAVLALLGGGSATQLTVLAGRYVQSHKLVGQLVDALPTLAQELAAPPVAAPTAGEGEFGS